MDRSIMSFLGLLSHLRSAAAEGAGGLPFNPALKIASTLLLVVLLSFSRGFLFVACAGALVLLVLSLNRGEVILRVLKTAIPVTGIMLLILLPAAFLAGSLLPMAIAAKVFISVTAVKLLASTTSWRGIAGGLRTLRVPALFILVLDIAVRYLVLLAGFSLEMLYSLKLRSVGRNDRKAGSLSGIGGTLFLRSRQMTEDLSAAMACRCFTGTYRGAGGAGLSAADLIPAAIDALLVAVFFLARA